MVGWLMREEMRWERHCGEGRAERKERCSAVRGSDVVAIVIDEIVDEKNGQVVLSLFLVRRCFIMLDSSMRRARAPSPSSPPSSSIAIVLFLQIA